MALMYVTTIAPSGIEIWVQTSVSGVPSHSAPACSLCAVVPDDAYYICLGGTTWQAIVISKDASDGVVAPGFFLSKTYVAADGDTDVTLPVRTGGWRVVDAYIISGGAAGTLQLKTGAGVAITDAITRGAANARTGAATIDLAAGTIASGGTLRITKAGGGGSGGSVFVRLEGL